MSYNLLKDYSEYRKTGIYYFYWQAQLFEGQGLLKYKHEHFVLIEKIKKKAMNVFEKEKRNLMIDFFVFIIACLASLGYVLYMFVSA